MLAAFVFVESRVEQPIVPLHLFKNATFSVSMLVGFLTAFGMFGSILFTPLVFQGVLGISATNSGALITPMMFGLIGASTADRLPDAPHQVLPVPRHGRRGRDDLRHVAALADHAGYPRVAGRRRPDRGRPRPRHHLPALPDRRAGGAARASTWAWPRARSSSGATSAAPSAARSSGAVLANRLPDYLSTAGRRPAPAAALLGGACPRAAAPTRSSTPPCWPSCRPRSSTRSAWRSPTPCTTSTCSPALILVVGSDLDRLHEGGPAHERRA